MLHSVELRLQLACNLRTVGHRFLRVGVCLPALFACARGKRAVTGLFSLLVLGALPGADCADMSYTVSFSSNGLCWHVKPLEFQRIFSSNGMFKLCTAPVAVSTSANNTPC